MYVCVCVCCSGAEHCARSCAGCAPLCLPPEEGVLLCACFLDAVVGCVIHPKLSICLIVRQYVLLSYCLSICPIVRQYVLLSHCLSICHIVRQYVPVSPIVFAFSFLITLHGTCGYMFLISFPSSMFVLCYVLYFSK